MGGHSQGQVKKRREGGKIRSRQCGSVGVHDRELEMTIRSGTTVTGNMLENRQYPVIQQSFGDRLREGSDRGRTLTISTVADHTIRPLYRPIGHRKTIVVASLRRK